MAKKGRKKRARKPMAAVESAKGSPGDGSGPDQAPRKLLSGRGVRWISVVAITSAITGFFSWLYPVAAHRAGLVFRHDKKIDVTVEHRNPRGVPPTASASPTGNAGPAKAGKVVKVVRGEHWNWELAFWTTPTPIDAGSVDSLNKMIADYGPVTDDFFAHTRAWVYARGGADGGVTYLRVVLRGASHDTVIDNVQADIVSRGRPQSGGVLFTKSEGGANVSKQRLDLDQQVPRSSYFTDHVVTLKKGEDHVIDVTAYTRKHFVVWNLRVDMVTDGHSESVYVDSRGRMHSQHGVGVPFRTSALLPSTAYRSGRQLTVEDPQSWAPLQGQRYNPVEFTDTLLNP